MKNFLLRTVKTVMFYTFIGILIQAFAANIIFAVTPVSGQELKEVSINIQLTDASLTDIFNTIELKTGFKFLYMKEELPWEAKISIKAENELLSVVLEKIAIDHRLAFKRVNKHIVVKKIDEKKDNEPLIQDAGAVKGKVISAETQEPLIGGNIILKGTNIGTATNESGEFTIVNIDEGTYELEVKYLGYKSQIINITIIPNKTLQLDDIYLTPTNVGLNEIIVSANLVEMERKAIPSALTVVTARDIEKLPAGKQINNLFRGEIAGGSAFDPGPYNYSTTVSLRGTSSLSFNNVKTYIDGIELAGDANSAAINLDNVERIEVLRGPQASTLYGSGASGGVMHIYTKKGTSGKTNVSAKVSSGIVESKWVDHTPTKQDYSLAVSGGNSGLSYNLSGSFLNEDPYVPEAYSKTTSLYGGLRVKGGLITYDFTAQFTRKDYAWPLNPILRDLGDIPFYSKPRNERNIHETTTLALNASYVPFDWWQHNLTIGGDNSEWDWERTLPRFTTPADTLLPTQLNATNKKSIRYYTTLRFSPAEAIKATLTAGFDYYSLENTAYIASTNYNQSAQRTSNFARVQRDNYTNTGYYAQLVVDVDESFYITSGVRLEKNDLFGEGADAVVAPRVGLSYAIDLDGTSFKPRFSYGTSIRPSNSIAKTGLQYSATQLAVPNPNIGPEKQTGYDVGIDAFFLDNAVSLELTYYNQKAIDLVADVLLSPAPIYTIQYQNVGEIKNSGFELAAKANIHPFTVNFTFTSTSSKIEKLSPTYTGDLAVGDNMRKIPRYNGGASVTYNYSSLFFDNPKQGGNITLGMVYYGGWEERDVLALYKFWFGIEPYRGSMRDYAMTYDGFTKLWLAADYNITENINVFLNIQNLTNSYDSEGTNTSTLAGRTTMLGLRLNY